ncbi:MAG: hypothetical protein N3D84_02055 [Candidatus Woesearchaeota archaeon]|nr:hypothetical protein [Candidatus Woesearchaeota archaeon]
MAVKKSKGFGLDCKNSTFYNSDNSNNNPLKDIYTRLNKNGENNSYIRYSKNVKMPLSDIAALETLEVGKSFPREHVLIAHYGTHLSVSYFGEDAASMRKTIERLKLPKRVPENLGERIFYLFGPYLENKDGPVLVANDHIIAGKEKGLELVLGKLIGIYKEDESNLQQQTENPLHL